MSEAKHELSPAIARKYDAQVTPTYVEHPVKDKDTGRKTGMIKVDLRKGTVKQADALFAAGFEGLKLKKATTSSN